MLSSSKPNFVSMIQSSDSSVWPWSQLDSVGTSAPQMPFTSDRHGDSGAALWINTLAQCALAREVEDEDGAPCNLRVIPHLHAVHPR
jgi:hypothetical protein